MNFKHCLIAAVACLVTALNVQAEAGCVGETRQADTTMIDGGSLEALQAAAPELWRFLHHATRHGERPLEVNSWGSGLRTPPPSADGQSAWEAYSYEFRIRQTAMGLDVMLVFENHPDQLARMKADLWLGEDGRMTGGHAVLQYASADRSDELVNW